MRITTANGLLKESVEIIGKMSYNILKRYGEM